jgi:hypothetical protein
MENLIVKSEDVQKMLQDGITKCLTEIFSRSYSNPLMGAIEKEIKDQDGAIRTLVKETLTNLISSEDFKSVLSKELMAKIVERGLRN